jgi:hypothetical protein
LKKETPLTDTKPTWLTYLLAERRELCALLQERQRVKLIADLKAVRAVEDRIRELALDPLCLSSADAPHPGLFVDALAALPSRFGSLPFVGSPEQVFNGASLTPGISVRLVPVVRERMLDLCGCLDDVITRKLNRDESVISAA